MERRENEPKTYEQVQALYASGQNIFRRSSVAALLEKIARLVACTPDPISVGNLRAIAYHLEQGEDNGGIPREALALFLRAVANDIDPQPAAPSPEA